VLCQRIGREDLAADPRFATYAARLVNRGELTRVLDEALSARPTEDWLARFAGAVPAAPVHDVAGALTSAFVTGEGRVWSYEHPRYPGFRMVPPAFRVPGETVPRRTAPALGGDTDTVLSELGYSKQRIADLRRGGII
jgi:succinate---hydroxymethylglutarate CoA-transferase